MVRKWNVSDTHVCRAVITADNNNKLSVRLYEQSHDFAMDKKRPAEGEIHIDGNDVSLSVKNLQQRDKGYKLIFIGRRNNNSVYKIMSDITPDQYGNAELRLVVNPEDIDGEGTSLSSFYVFMIAVMGKPIKPALQGDCVELRKTSYRTGRTEDAEDRKKEGKAVVSEKRKQYNNYYSEYIRIKVAELMDDKNVYADISPFDDEWLTDSWKRVDAQKKFPVVSIDAENQIVKYRHFIYGFTEEHFYLGVPGRHIEEEWPEKGKSGFMLWQPIRGSGEYGYWIAVIDWNLGIITEIS